MTTYAINYASQSNDRPVDLEIDAKNDAQAVKAVRKMVCDGYRNQAWGNVEVSGKMYIARNVHGRAVGHYIIL